MVSFVYPAVFKWCEAETYFVQFPDLPTAMTEGYSLSEAIYMAEDVLRIVVKEYLERGESLPTPTDIKQIRTEDNEFVSLIRAEVHKTNAVRKVVRLPQWMVEKAAEKHISLSKTLQIALKERLNA